jgi:uncharacterized membrane protein YeaQ/YmgE (transglycosylase-associated protein family)
MLGLAVSPPGSDSQLMYNAQALNPDMLPVRRGLAGKRIQEHVVFSLDRIGADCRVHRSKIVNKSSKIVNKKGEGLIRDIILGVVGAIVGGWVFSVFGASDVTGLNLYSLVVAVVGSIVVLGGVARDSPRCLSNSASG